MAKAETNQRKREEIKAIMAAVLARGWTLTMLAAYTGHTASCLSAWKLGKSMGTNAERELLAALPAPDAPEVRAHLVERVQEAERELRRAEKYLADNLSGAEFAKNCRNAQRCAASWAADYRRSLADVSDEASRKDFEEKVAKYEAIATDLATCEAAVRADYTRWSKISGARQALKTVEAVLASLDREESAPVDDGSDEPAGDC